MDAVEGIFHSPSVHHIVSVLEERIRLGEYRPGRWLPSERQLSEEFGVSRIVVQSVLKELERRELVSRAARCRPIVRQSAGPETPPLGVTRRTLGLWIWPGPADAVASTVVHGIYQTLDHDAFRLVVGHPIGTDWNAALQSERRFLECIARDRDVVGVLLWYLGGPVNLSALRTVRAAHIPMVFMDRQPPDGFAADYVGMDNLHAAEQIVKHLITQGHRRIAHITNLDHASTVSERLEGYRRALEGARIAFRPELVLTETAPAPGCPQRVYEDLAERLLTLPDPPTAIFTVNDRLAFHLLAALRDRGVRVPEDLAIAGFDGIVQEPQKPPFLTTIKQPFGRIGSRAVDLLMQRIGVGPDAVYKHIVLEGALSLNESTRYGPKRERCSA